MNVVSASAFLALFGFDGFAAFAGFGAGAAVAG
jgi:hypothetical protein